MKGGAIRRAAVSAARLLLAGAMLAAAGCEGENLFGGPSIGADRASPTVRIELPDSGQRVAVGDSVLVRVRLTDDQGLARLDLSGFALRGSVDLGTGARVERFEPKSLDFEAVRPFVRDTTVSRYLLATADSLAEEGVLLVARAVDLAGREAADTLRIGLGGPRVQIAASAAGGSVRAGSDLRIHISAADTANRLLRIRLAAEGDLRLDTILDFDPPRPAVDTIVDLAVPLSATAGEFRLRAVAKNAANDSTVSQPLALRLLEPAQDTRAPVVRFRIAAPPRAERDDSIAVTVVATDDTRVGRVGVTLLPIHRRAGSTDTLAVTSRTQASDSVTFRVSLADLGVPVPSDTSTLRVEVTAFALDAAGNCATATVPNTPLSEACTGGDPVFGVRPGARGELLVVRGRTVRVGVPGDHFADIAADAQHVYLSNLTRNRLEVLPIGSLTPRPPVSVGSRPWGLAFNRERTRLYVANSGGTNISVVSPATLAEVERIQTPNVKLYDASFEPRTVASSPESTDSAVAYFPSSVARYDYSDRPQFIGVTRNENLIFSTLPTAAARDGTIRVHRRAQDRLEIITDYTEERIGNRVVIANADSVFLVVTAPNDLIRVCPRNRSLDPALDRNLPAACYTGSIDEVQDRIRTAGYDTRFLYNVDIGEIGLSDTTFVAVSGDHGTIAFGEGARENARVMAFVEPAGQVHGPLVKAGDIRDLIGNVAERVIGLALNHDGSLGIARGNEAYFFTPDLRLQGMVETESGEGGVEMHLDNPAVRRAFVSGVQPDGLAFIDVMDTFHFRQVARIFLRDPVKGPIRAVRAADGALRIYAVTEEGLVAVDVHAHDL